MEKYNYQECVCEDIRKYLKNHDIKDERVAGSYQIADYILEELVK